MDIFLLWVLPVLVNSLGLIGFTYYHGGLRALKPTWLEAVGALVFALSPGLSLFVAVAFVSCGITRLLANLDRPIFKD